MQIRCILALLLVALATQSRAELARVRFTQHGMDYAGGIVKDILQKDPNLKPGSSLGESQSGKTTVSVTLQEFRAPNMRLVSVAPNSLRFISNGGSIKVHVRGKWRQNRFLKGSVSGTARASSININLQAALAKAANGKLQLTPGSCDVSLGGLKVEIGKGLIKKLIQPVTNLVVSLMKKSMYGKLCKAINKAILDKANPQLARSDMSIRIDDEAKLELTLAKNPAMTAAYFDVSLDGGIKEGSAVVPIPSAPIPPSTLSQNQAYFWLSEAAANAAFDFSLKQGLLRYTVGKEALSQKHHEKLQTTCDGGLLPPKCIGAVLPTVAEMYPDTFAYALVAAREAPRIGIEEGKVTIHLKAEMAINVENPKDAPIFKSHVDFKSTISVRVEKRGDQYHLVGELLPNSGEIKLDIIESHIGGIVDSAIKALIKLAEPFMLEFFNAQLNKGYALPNIAMFELVTPNLAFEKGALRIETSVNYKP